METGLDFGGGGGFELAFEEIKSAYDSWISGRKRKFS